MVQEKGHSKNLMKEFYRKLFSFREGTKVVLKIDTQFFDSNDKSFILKKGTKGVVDFYTEGYPIIYVNFEGCKYPCLLDVRRVEVS